MTDNLYQKLKDMVDLRDVAVRHVNPIRTARKYISVLCHWHNEDPRNRRGDMSVFADGFYCNQCGAHGDLFDWVEKFEGKAKRDVLIEYGLIQGDTQVKFTYVPTQRRIVTPFTEEDLAEVEITNEFIDSIADTGCQKAYDYWKQWGISGTTVANFNLGYVRRSDTYAGYTIPHYFTTPDGEIRVKGLKLRRDDEVAPQLPKYIGARTSLYGGVYNDRRVTSPDGKRIGPKLNFCFVTEDEKTTWLLEQLGYPSVSYKQKSGWHEFLPTVFQNVAVTIIVADNDETAGMSNALNIQEALGQHYSKIIACESHKQFSDMSKDLGTDAVDAALRKMLPGVL